MTFRVETVQTVRRVGFVEIEATTPDEARECVQRLGRLPGHGALHVTQTEDIRMGPLEVVDVQASEAA